MSYKTKAEALHSIFGGYGMDFSFLGVKALYPMNDNTVAEIALSGSSNHESLIVTIQNKEHGTVATDVFRFEEYLTRTECSNPNGKSVKKMHFWQDRDCIDWYIVRPKSTKPIFDAIMKYIKIYT